MEEANGWRVQKPRQLPAFEHPPVIHLAGVGPFPAAPEFLLRRQESDHIAILVNEIGRDAVTVPRPAAMAARGRSVVWVSFDPVGVVVREHDGRTQGVDHAHCDDGGPRLHLAFPAGGYATQLRRWPAPRTRWRSLSCPVPRARRQRYFSWPANAAVFQLDCKSGEPSDPLSSVDKLLTLEDNGGCGRVCVD